MLRWLRNRKEKKEQRRQEKHRRILNALKACDTTGSGQSDYGFYSDEFLRNCDTETTPHDYEEISDVHNMRNVGSASQMSSSVTRIIGTNSSLDTNTTTQPPQLPERVFSVTACPLSSGYRKSLPREKFKHVKERTISQPYFVNDNEFTITTDADSEPLYNAPWDFKSNSALKCGSDNSFNDHMEDLHSKNTLKQNFAAKKEKISRWSRISEESTIYSEIFDSDSETISQTEHVEGEDGVFINGISKIYSCQKSKCTLSNDFDENYETDSNASSGFCDGLNETDEENKHLLMRSLGNPEYTISSLCLFNGNSNRFNSLPRFRCSKIYEDEDLYLVPKRSQSLKETTTTTKLDFPVQKKKYRLGQCTFYGSKNRNKVLEDVIWRNNFKQHVSFL